jgi:predicted anti-sigma-YlaC factor YlaD
MQCSEISEWMSLYLDGLVSQEQGAQLQAHVAQCQACGGEWEAMRSLSSLLRAEPMAIPAPGFTARVAQRLHRRQALRRRLLSSLGVLMGSVGLWAIVGLALSLVLIVLWQAPMRIILSEVAIPLARSAVATRAALGRALRSALDELSLRPTGLFLLGYAVLALGLTLLWTRIVFQHREARASLNSKI